MSIDATRWAWLQAGIKASDKLVLLSLADRADESHRCWPGVIRLSKDTCLDRKTVLAAISRLEAAGLLSCQRQQGGSTVYTLIGVAARETSPEIGTGPENGTGPKSGTATSPKNGTGVVPKAGPPPVPFLGHEPKSKPKKNLTSVMVGDFPDLSADVAAEFLAYRKRHRAELTPTAWKRMAAEIRRSGWSAEDALAETMLRSWRGFKADWVAQEQQRTGRSHREL